MAHATSASSAKPERSQADDVSVIAEVLGRPGAAIAPELKSVFERFVPVLLARMDTVQRQSVGGDALAAIAVAAFRALQRHRRGGRIVDIARLPRAAAVSTDAGARGEGRALIAVVNDDKPFLVSSVLGEMQARGVRTELVLHPLFAVRRAGDGHLLDLAAAARAGEAERAAGAGWNDESLIVVVADAVDEAAGEALRAAIEHVLDDVDAAVGDWPRMMARFDAEIATLAARSGSEASPLLGETIAFCRWMRDGQFVFLGMREYRLVGDAEHGSLDVIPGSGLGILADPGVHVLRRGRELVVLTDEIRRFYLKPAPIIITKSNVVSRVHRRVHMDYVGLKTYAADGSLAGELRILGLFTATAYTATPGEIPFLRVKVERVFEAAGIAHAGHEGRMLQNILDTFPRDELFQIGVTQLASWVPALLQLEFAPRIRVLVRRDRFDRFVSVLVFVPRDRFSTSVRERIGALLADVFKGRMVTFQPYFTAGPLVRVHYIIGRYEGATPVVDEAWLEAAVGDIAATWEDRLGGHLGGIADGAARFAGAFPAAYAETFDPQRALDDIGRIARLTDATPVSIEFHAAEARPDAAAEQGAARVAIHRLDRAIPLSERVPLLENLGFSVIDERTYTIRPRLDGVTRDVYLHDMTLRTFDGRPFDLVRVDAALEDAFHAVFSGRADNDVFNRLVMVAECDWREAAMLRAYAGYMRQIGLPFGPRYVAETLSRHAARAGDLVRLFKIRLDPGSPADEAERAEREVRWRAAFDAALGEVRSLDEDRILRTLHGLIAATVRTNFFMCDAHGRSPATIAFKIASRDVADVPEPKPFREIWVTSPEVDGVHLRFAPIARGGLRWSDRAQDFRTEVLGLAKAQQVKNTVIVPQGAKGGFVPKRMPAGANRDAVMKAGVAAYRTFVSTLLDITDNLAGGVVVPPDGVVRRDGDDPYLVVAADKGTATFSDFANALSAEHRFWLDDAFASGGSAGYDHKKMGITARGAWECVERHFREMDRDIQRQPFRVIGVGDMSGDVFGNGMLLSPEIRLVAAFDHRDIFIDPEPDAAASLAERQRLFALPRSSWQDYDRSLISKGGGVFSRAAKSIDVGAEIAALLGLTAERVTPAEMMRAVLTCAADLLWLGGIGTYVRGDNESDADVGDRGNDAVRIAASQLRVAVIGEGANLGMTQRARIDFAARGGRLDTDFIDNSAGVNSSDQEVNIKIALAPALADGRLDLAARNALLATMTDDVAQACLDNNYAQSLALSLAERQGGDGIADAQHLMRTLEQRGLLHRGLEVLPGDAALAERSKAGRGLTRPEHAVLLAHAKIALSYDLIASQVPDDAGMTAVLAGYFPPALRKDFAADIAAHPLRREIVTTELTNRIVNMCGAELASRIADDFGLDTEQTARVLIGAIDVLDAEALFQEVGALDTRIRGADQLALYGEVRRLLRELACSIATAARGLRPLGPAIARIGAVYRALDGDLDAALTPARRAAHGVRMAEWASLGAGPQLARRLAAAASLFEIADLAMVSAADLGGPHLQRAARVYFGIGDMLWLSDLERRGRAVAAADRYDRLAIASALASLAESHRRIAARVLQSGAGSAEMLLERWREEAAGPISRAVAGLAEIAEAAPVSVARLTVAAAIARELGGG
jgi:glutamate dehydrogenase